MKKLPGSIIFSLVVLFFGCHSSLRIPTPTCHDCDDGLSPPLLNSLLRVLQSSHLSESTEYLYLSAAMALTAPDSRGEMLDTVLDPTRHPERSTEFAGLTHLWWGDNALFSHRYSVAEHRYRSLLDSLERSSKPTVWILDRPLADAVSLQLATALALQERYREAAKRVERLAAESYSQRSQLKRIAATYWWEAEEHSHSRSLLRHSPLPSFSRPPFRLAPPVVPRTLAQLELLAPWPSGTFLLTGSLDGSPRRLLSWVMKGGRAGARSSPCGLAAAGYYYDAGSHAARRSAGRRQYAIDFSQAGSSGVDWGRGTFGVQARASGDGIVGFAYYGTRTHHNIRTFGPTPANNQANVFHFPAEVNLLHALFGISTPDPRRQSLLRTHYFSSSWDYSTSYHHLAGIESRSRRKWLERDADSQHPPSALVSLGQYVWSGTPLGIIDSTGYSTIDHLHFEIFQNCKLQPTSCLDISESPGASVTIPVIFEGQHLDHDAAARCLESTNEKVLDEDANQDGWPDVLPWPG